MSSIYSPLGEYQFTPGWGKRWTLIPVTKYVPPENPVSIVGIQAGTARLIIAAHDSNGVKVTLTQTTFDTTTRADSARILVTNSTGAAAVIRGAGVYAKAYTKLSGAEGYIHDKFVDYESIAKNGEQKFELGNDMVTTFAQVNDLADYHWKDKKTRRHIYSLTLMGMQTFFEPGEWYTLTIGNAGEQEYISSVCVCYGVRSRLSATGLGQTAVAFREVYQNWVFDSNEVARSRASGRDVKIETNNVVVVAPAGNIGKANYYCDGAEDESEITAASTFLSGAYGGGTVKLLPGSYSISSYISVLSSIKYEGEGFSTILSAHNGLCFQSTAGSEISSLTIGNVAIVAATGFSAINITGGSNTVDTVKITNVTSDAVFLGSVTSPTRNINNCIIAGGATASTIVYGVRTIGTDSNIWNNTITGLKSSVATYGIFTTGGGQVISNNISTLTATLTSATAYGIAVVGNDTIINSNRIDTIKNSATSTTAAYGIFITTSLTHISVVQNIVHDCANDTLYANTGSWLFKDNATSTLTSVNSWQ